MGKYRRCHQRIDIDFWSSSNQKSQGRIIP